MIFSVKETFKAIRRAAGLGASYLIPRSRRKWVFGGVGYDNNSAYLFIWLNEHNHFGIKPIWIGKHDTVKKMRALGFKAHTPYGLPGKWHMLTSKVWLFTSYISDISTYLHGNACMVNLWHGVGIKSIEHKISTGPLAEFYAEKSWIHRMLNHEKFEKPTLFLSTSPMMTRHFSECFNIRPERCIVAGYPRCEILRYSDADADAYVLRHFDKQLQSAYTHLKSFDYVYFYLPTWRDTGRNFVADDGLDFDRINEIMAEKNAIFAFKPHINTHLPEEIMGEKYSNVVILDPRTELYPLLRLADTLITDYSSVYYDYLLRPGGKTVFFLPDYEEYMSRERDLAFPFNENTIGIKVYNVEDFYNILSDADPTMPDATEIQQRFWSSDGGNEQIVSEILRRIK